MIKGNLAIIFNHLFQTLLITYLLLLLAEQIWPGVISIYINLNYLLIIVILSGILDVFSVKPPTNRSPPTSGDYIFILALSILGSIIIKFKTAQLNLLSWIISIIAGVLIFLLSVIIINDEDKQNHENK